MHPPSPTNSSPSRPSPTLPSLPHPAPFLRPSPPQIPTHPISPPPPRNLCSQKRHVDKMPPHMAHHPAVTPSRWLRPCRTRLSCMAQMPSEYDFKPSLPHPIPCTPPLPTPKPPILPRTCYCKSVSRMKCCHPQLSASPLPTVHLSAVCSYSFVSVTSEG